MSANEDIIEIADAAAIPSTDNLSLPSVDANDSTSKTNLRPSSALRLSLYVLTFDFTHLPTLILAVESFSSGT
jgi:hypothetical protein